MPNYFKKAESYVSSLDMNTADSLDRKAHQLLNDEAAYERASQSLRRRFVRGATQVEGIDRSGRSAFIKREIKGAKFKYMVQGADGNWFEPDERIWVVSMYACWQDSKRM